MLSSKQYTNNIIYSETLSAWEVTVPPKLFPFHPEIAKNFRFLKWTLTYSDDLHEAQTIVKWRGTWNGNRKTRLKPNELYNGP